MLGWPVQMYFCMHSLICSLKPACRLAGAVPFSVQGNQDEMMLSGPVTAQTQALSPSILEYREYKPHSSLGKGPSLRN